MTKADGIKINPVQTNGNAFVSNRAWPAFLGLMTVSIVLHAILEGILHNCMSCTKMPHHWPAKHVVLANINLIRRQPAKIVLLDGTTTKNHKPNV